MRVRDIVFCTMVCIWLMLYSLVPVMAQTEDGAYRIFRPDGPGPHPGVVFISGCGGFKPEIAPKAYEHPAEELRKLGFVVVWADYLGRRDLPNCWFGVTKDEAGRDAVAAALWLRSQPYVDAKRIAAMGWSFGGGAVLAALGSHSADQLIFTKVIVYYPSCGDVGPYSNRIPVLVLRGGSDNVVNHKLCESTFATGSGEANVKIIEYPGAHHCFDFSELPPEIQQPLGTFGYHPQAAAAAWEEVLQFLKATR
jgi:dienelactone hydrolase